MWLVDLRQDPGSWTHINATLNKSLINVVHFDYFHASFPPSQIGLFGVLIVGEGQKHKCIM